MFENITLSIVANVLGDFGKGIISKFLYRRKKEKLEKLINKKFLEKLGNELYYNDLDSFLVEENFIDKIISYSTGNKVDGVKSIKMYVELLSEKFIQNKSNHWLYKSDIKKTIFILALTIFEVLNEYRNDENARVIITVLREEFRNGFYELGNKITVLEDNIETNTATVKDALKILYEQDEKSTGIIVDKLNAIQDMLTDDKLGPKNVAMSNIADDFKDSPYFERINQIEKNLQSKHVFDKAIEAYDEIIRELVSLNATSNKRLLFTLYLNLALCYLNVGKYNEGIKNLDYAETQDSENEKLYYVKAVFYTYSPSENNYKQALENLNIAISKKENYYRAVFLRYYVQVAIDPNTFENVLAESKDYFEKELSKSTDNSLISEYYFSIGLAAKISRKYQYAIECFEKAEEFEENIVNKINIAYTYYAWALKDNDRGGYVLLPNIDFEKFDLCYKLCKELLDSDDPIAIVYRDTIREILISISTFGNVKYNIADLLPKDISSIEDYSAKRAALFSVGAQRKLTAEEIVLLSDLDKKIYTAHQLERQGKYNEAKNILEELLNEENAEHFMMIVHNLLVLCITSKDPEKYKEIRQISVKEGIIIPDIGILDCLYEEIIGKEISEIKDRITIIKNRTTDVIGKYQILLFYIRHGFNDEAIELIKEIHRIINEHAVSYIDNEDFYKTIINFVIEKDLGFAVEICDTLCSDKVSKELYLKINIVVNNKTRNNKKLKNTLYDYYVLTKNIVCLYDASVAALLDFDNAKCEEYSIELLSTSDNMDLKAKAYMMLSNSNFLKGDFAKAFEYATNAHEEVIDMPNHQAHQFFMQRSLMTGNLENSLVELQHYKENHPIIVDWFETISVEETDDGTALINKIKKVTGDSKYQEIQDLFKKALEIISIYQVSEIFDCRVVKTIEKTILSNSKFMLSTGNIKDVNEELANISSKIVVDSYTLLILGYFGIINILDEFDEILVTPQTVESVITESLNSSYENVIYVYDYLKNSLKVSIYPCLNSVKKSVDDFCPDEIIACNILSKCENVSYLYADFRIKSVLSEINVKMISIVTAIAYIAKEKKHLSSQYTYRLLKSKNCHFINFDATDIMNIIKNDTVVKKDILLPFLCLTSDCDVDSFAFVYANVLKQLILEGDSNRIVDYTTVIFEYCNQIFKKALTHLYLDKYNKDSRGIPLIKFVKTVIINFRTVLTENKYDAEKMILSIKWNANVKTHIISMLNNDA